MQPARNRRHRSQTCGMLPVAADPLEIRMLLSTTNQIEFEHADDSGTEDGDRGDRESQSEHSDHDDAQEHHEYDEETAADEHRNNSEDSDHTESGHDDDSHDDDSHDISDESEHSGDNDHVGEDSGEQNDGDGRELRAALVGATAASGTAEFEMETEHRQEERSFQVDVRGLTPGSSHSVMVDGIDAGTVQVGDRGFGRLTLSDDPEHDEQQMPAGFPDVTAASIVTVGTDLEGPFSDSNRDTQTSPGEYAAVYELDHRLGLQVAGNLFENWGGLGEKWLYGDDGWYFIQPDGALYHWTGGSGATGDLVATLDPAFFDTPELLYDSQAEKTATIDNDLARLTAADLDHDLDLHADGSYYENWGGEGEKWVQGRDGWYFITPDGSLYQWTRGSGVNGELVAGLDSRFHADPTLLTEALQNLTVEEAAYAIDHGLNLRTTPGDFLNWGGRNEKWLRGVGGWYFITPDGGFYQWNGQPTAAGTQITTLSTAYYEDLSLLASAPSLGRPEIERLLDDVFAELPSTFN